MHPLLPAKLPAMGLRLGEASQTELVETWVCLKTHRPLFLLGLGGCHVRGKRVHRHWNTDHQPGT